MRPGFLLLVSAAGLAVAREGPKRAACEPLSICVDGINECGEPWGGCYDYCKPMEAPDIPPCKPKDLCKRRTICIDGINHCGVSYSSCFSACKPWPFTVPPCSTATSLPMAAASATATPTGE